MPLYKTISLSDNAVVLIWKINESYSDLYQSVTLTEESEFRLQGMKSKPHRKAFLAVRKLLQTIGYTDFDVFYERSGKPHLLDDHYISITHSFDYAAIIVSEKRCGIDIEKQRDKISVIQHKFLNFNEINVLSENKIKDLTLVWATKETLYKLIDVQGLSFKEHMNVLCLNEKIKAEVFVNDKLIQFEAYAEEIESFILVYSEFENGYI